MRSNFTPASKFCHKILTPLSIYVHIPYCLEKCPYCDFHSIAIHKDEIPEQRYLVALEAQLRWEAERLKLKNRSLVSIFFGGGTPSLMSPKFYEKFLGALSRHFVLNSEMEITVETNPSTATFENFREWLSIGINRISFGVQSFQDGLLKKLGRGHTSLDAKNAIFSALKANFSNLSLDLIFGIEGETLKELEEDLETAISLNLPHTSVYQLTVESGTPLASWVAQGKWKTLEEETLTQMYKMVFEILEAKGWSRYEISNYAREGFESRHNLQYWQYGDYLGLGSGAVSFIAGKRWRTTRKLKSYLSESWDYEEEEIIDSKTQLKEKWMMGLRLRKGVALDCLFDKCHPILSQLKEEGFLSQADGRIFLTQKGFLVYNRIVQNIFDLIDKM